MPDHRPLSRRTLLTGTVTGLGASALLTGCDTGEEITPPGASTSGTTGSMSPSVERSPDPQPTADEALVSEVALGLLAAVELLTRAREAPPLRPVLKPLLRAHRRHLQVLVPEDGQDTFVVLPDAPGEGLVAQDLAAVRRSERRLHALLVDTAGHAESGALARLLASMAASVTQHLAVLPAEGSR